MAATQMTQTDVAEMLLVRYLDLSRHWSKVSGIVRLGGETRAEVFSPTRKEAAGRVPVMHTPQLLP